MFKQLCLCSFIVLLFHLSGPGHALAHYSDQSGEKAYSEGKYGDALRYWEESVRFYRERSDQEKEGVYLGGVGWCYFNLGYFNRAREYFSKALDTAYRLQNNYHVAERLNALGNAFYRLQDFKNAGTHFRNSLNISRSISYNAYVFRNITGLGWTCYGQGDFNKALDYFRQAVNLRQDEKKKEEELEIVSGLAWSFLGKGDHDGSLANFKKAADISAGLRLHGPLAKAYAGMGNTVMAKGDMNAALAHFKKAGDIFRQYGMRADYAWILLSIGSLNRTTGSWDKALDNYLEAHKIYDSLSLDADKAGTLYHIGWIYFEWGMMDEAGSYFARSMDIYRRRGLRQGIAWSLCGQSTILRFEGSYAKALEGYREALQIFRETENLTGIMSSLNYMGLVYYYMEDFDKALAFYQEALGKARSLNLAASIALFRNNGAYVNYERDRYEEAMKGYAEALPAIRQAKNMALESLILNNMGEVYYKQTRYADAEQHFKKAVDIKETLRQTATGPVRRNYLKSQIESYQYLVSTSARQQNWEQAFAYRELSSARYLADLLREKMRTAEFRFSGIRNYASKLDDKTAVISFANLNWNDLVILAADKNIISGREVPIRNFFNRIISEKRLDMKKSLQKEIPVRGVSLRQKETPGGTENNLLGIRFLKLLNDNRSSMESIVNYYRFLISKPFHDGNDRRRFQFLSREFYRLLIASVEDVIREKEHLIIQPDGILGFLPFETLQDETGRFLVEKYQIKYAQSLTVNELIAERSLTGKTGLLAFGGAVYETAAHESTAGKRGLSTLKKDVDAALAGQANLREYYGYMGLNRWENLPGTLQEVQALQKTFKEAVVYTGKDASEEKIKELSGRGELKKYDTIHFATHGLVISDIPELSALVLSQTETGKGREDGYLTMFEIAALDIRSRFVNLSACETGLGKIYGGEGVVGLIQSFILAGADGLSVSLWQVADESTSEFMKSVYRRTVNKKESYPEAIAQTKRAFLKDAAYRKYRDPFYWAPFVYYGQ